MNVCPRRPGKRLRSSAFAISSDEAFRHKKPRERGVLRGDGAETRNRTADLLITNQLLYRLSYFGVDRAFDTFSIGSQKPGAREYFIPMVELKGFFLLIARSEFPIR